MCNYSEKLNWFTTDRLESLVDSHFSEERNCCKREIGNETGLTWNNRLHMVATQYFRCWPFRQRIYFHGFLWRRSPWLMPVSPGNELSMKISAFHFWKRSINNMLQLLLVEIKAHWWNSMLWTKKRRSDSPLYLRGTRNRWMFSQLIVKTSLPSLGAVTTG